ncbi:MAG: endonuclease NucS domain-containing protein [Nitrososphaerales archaeon]
MPLPVIRLELYYKSNESHTRPIEETMKECEEISSDFNVSFSSFENSQMDDEMKSRVADKIRSIIPQRRGAIVTSRKMILPLSGTSRLNLGNTPILVVENDGKPVLVFPCRLGETYYSLEDGIAYLKANLPELSPLIGSSEEDIMAFILKQPEVLEKGLHDPRKEVETLSGAIDLLFLDANNRCLLIEVEREANDASLGQTLRLCAAYERKLALPNNSVRGMVACMRAGESIKDAASRAGIEIRVIETKEIEAKERGSLSV